MNVKVSKIKFESTNDVVEYVSKGRVPSKKNFESLMTSITDGSKVVIPNNITGLPERKEYYQKEMRARQQLRDILTVVYASRKKNRRKLILIGALVGLGVVTGVGAITYMIGKHSVEENDDELYTDDYISEDDLDVCDIPIKDDEDVNTEDF